MVPIRAKCFSPAEGQLVNVTDDQAVRDVRRVDGLLGAEVVGILDIVPAARQRPPRSPLHVVQEL